MKKISILIVLAMLITTFAACSTDEIISTSETTASETAAKETVAETEAVFPHEAMTFDGFELTLFADYNAGDALSITDFNLTQDDTGDILNDAVFRRNLLISETFDVKLTSIESENNTFPAQLRQSADSGDNLYQVAGVRYTNAKALFVDGYAYNLMELDNITLDAPWWDSRSVEKLTINDKLYIVAGDFFYKHYDGIELIMFNKEIAKKYQVGDIYSIVTEGKWTLDKLAELCEITTIDLNGDGIIEEENDLYGLASQLDIATTFIISSDITLIEKNSSGELMLTKNTEKIHSVLDLVNEFYIDYAWDAHRDVGAQYGPGRLFVNNHSLFCWGKARSLFMEAYRDMETEFGIIPFPKYDEAQEDYLGYVNFYHGYALMIPSSVTEPETVAYLMDAIAFYGKQMVTPAYYESSLTRKYVRDDESEAMLDLIFQNATYDIGIYYNVGGIRTIITNNVKSGNNTFFSDLAEIKPVIETDIALLQE